MKKEAKKENTLEKTRRKENATTDFKKSVKKTKKQKIEFLKSPMAFGLAYFPGEKTELEAKQAEELIDAGFAKKL